MTTSLEQRIKELEAKLHQSEQKSAEYLASNVRLTEESSSLIIKLKQVEKERDEWKSYGQIKDETATTFMNQVKRLQKEQEELHSIAQQLAEALKPFGSETYPIPWGQIKAVMPNTMAKDLTSFNVAADKALTRAKSAGLIKE